MIHLMISCWAAFCLGPHSKGTSFLVSAVSGAAIIEKSLQNIRW